jgi:PRTRC genetic system protein B
MERMRHPDEAEVADYEEMSGADSQPGLEEYLTSDVILDLLKMPTDGLIRINSALFFLGGNEQFAYYSRDSQTGKQTCKLLDVDAVHAAFQPMPMSSGWLPPGSLRFGIDATGQRWISIAIPPATRQISIIDNDLGQQQLEVPLPGLIFTGLGRNYWIWAVKSREIGPTTELYHAPLSNVSSQGSICFGANQIPVADETTMLPALSLFLESPFNGHLAASKSRTHQGDIRFLLQDLARRKASQFPLEELCPILAGREPPGKTVGLETLLHAIVRRGA